MDQFRVIVHNTNKALRLHGTIAHDLGVEIVSGKYRPGDILSGEIASSEQLSVSRTAYREAIRILAAKGLVSSKPKIGTKVNAKGKWHILDPDVLAWMFEAGPDITALNSLFELRDVVEPTAAAFAAIRRTDGQLRTMATAIDRMERHTLMTEAGRQADVDFHATLLQASDNPFITSLVEGFTAAITSTNIYKQREHPLRRDPVPDHAHVYDAIADKDADKAQLAMRELIRLARIDTPFFPPPKRRPLKIDKDQEH
ncbi:MAG: FadR/GntR family transcriptional regulator [Rhizomicrobium sp.]